MTESNNKASRLKDAYEETRLELANHRALFPDGGGPDDYELTTAAFENRLSSLSVQMAEHSGQIPAWMQNSTIQKWDKLWDMVDTSRRQGRHEEVETIMSEIKAMIPIIDKLTQSGGID